MRTFLAIPLPAPLRRAALEAGRALVSHPDGWRFVREDAVHLTIRFLGEVPPARLQALDEGWRVAARGTGPLALTLGGAGVFPHERRPRVLWFGLTDRTPHGGLALLAERVERAATEAGFAPDRRPFAPHVTLARARENGRALVGPLAEAGALGDFTADRLVRFRSELGPGGARHFEEASFPLAAEATP